MSISTWIQGVVTGLTVAFAIWGLKQLFLRRQLSLVQPRLFDYSGLGGKGSSKTIELTIINAGKRAEEDVRVQFAPDFTYSIIAANTSGLNINNEGVLLIDRIAPKQEVTLIVIAEGGEFRKEHVLGLTSKDGTGTIKSNLQEAQTTPAQVAFGLAIFVFLILPLGYAAGKMVEWNFGERIEAAILGSSSGADRKPEPKAEVLEAKEGDLQIAQTSYGMKPQLQQALASTVHVTAARRLGSIVTLDVQLTNNSQERLVYSVSLVSAASDQRDKAGVPIKYIDSEIIVFPGSTKSVSLQDYLPFNSSPQVVLFKAAIERNNDRIWITRDVSLKANQSAGPVAATPVDASRTN